MIYSTVREEEVKNKIAQDYFSHFDATKIIGNIDFSIVLKDQIFLWAEAKKGNVDLYKSIVQLILTIGKARTFDHHLPPAYLGAFDAEKMAFIPYNEVQEFFYLNDFNWNVAPSNYNSREFSLILEKISPIIDENAWIFYYHQDEVEIKTFIKTPRPFSGPLY